MFKQLRDHLQSLGDWSEREAPPVVALELYFEGNTEEECIAPNDWGYGRPPIAELYARFKPIAARPDVERVLVGLHHDWLDEMLADGYPPGDHVHLYTTADGETVESWLGGLKTDGALPGWPHGEPRNAPKPSAGYKVYSVVWD